MVTIQSQNFGVEIEMTGVSRGTAASVIANYFGVGGIHFAGGTYQTYEAKDSISIHALREEGDSKNREKILCFCLIIHLPAQIAKRSL